MEDLKGVKMLERIFDGEFRSTYIILNKVDVFP